MRVRFKMVWNKNWRSNFASLNIKSPFFAGLRTFCEQGHGRGEFKMFFHFLSQSHSMFVIAI